MGEWISANWFTGLSAIGIVGSLVFTAASFRSETKTRRIANLLTLTRNHRELWSELICNPNLTRVLDPAADLSQRTITRDETIYLNLVIQHLGSAYQAMKSGLVVKPEGVSQDIRTFFSLPIPGAIWEKIKLLQNDDFVEFVERCRGGEPITLKPSSA
ncbi:MAG: DUF6082 family protein [Verrucomicrobiota bacterium]|jgi:hypothetical protein